MSSSGHGTAIQAARKSLGLSVAKASALVRVSPATIKRWEAGQGLPPKSELLSYLDRLGLPTSSPVRDSLESLTAPTGFREAREDLSDRPVLRLLRSKRRRNGITLTELSAATGLSVASLYRYETGQRAPDDSTLRALAVAVGCNDHETEGLRLALYGPPAETTVTKESELALSFLVPDNDSHLRVFELLDQILHSGGNAPSAPWDAFHGLLIMGEHDTVREVWPELKPVLSPDKMSFEERVLIRTTLAMVRSTFEAVDPSVLGKLGSGAISLRPGTNQMMAMLHLARLAMAAGDLEQADSWIRSVEEYGSRVGDDGILFLAELNRHAVDFERSRSSAAITAIEGLRERAEGSLQAYNVDVALSHMHAVRGDEGSTESVLEQCADAEATYGFGSPLARKVRRKRKE